MYTFTISYWWTNDKLLPRTKFGWCDFSPCIVVSFFGVPFFFHFITLWMASMSIQSYKLSNNKTYVKKSLFFYLNHTQRRLLYGKPIYLFSFTHPTWKLEKQKILLHEIDNIEKLTEYKHYTTISNIKYWMEIKDDVIGYKYIYILSTKKCYSQLIIKAFEPIKLVTFWLMDEVYTVWIINYYALCGFYSSFETNIIYETLSKWWRQFLIMQFFQFTKWDLVWKVNTTMPEPYFQIFLFSVNNLIII